MSAESRKRVYVAGSGVCLGKHEVTNEQLSGWFNAALSTTSTNNDASSPQVIEKLSGIRSRRIEFIEGIEEKLSPAIPKLPDNVPSIQASFGHKAVVQALKEASLSAGEVDLVVFASSAIQRPYPAVAIELASLMGSSAIGFDVNVGCSSAVYAVSICEQFLRQGTVKTAIIVTSEFPTLYANWKDRGSNFLFGDASSALVLTTLENSAASNKFELLNSKMWSQYSSTIRNNFGFMFPSEQGEPDRSDRFFYQNGPKVFKDIVREVPGFIRRHLSEQGVGLDQVRRFWLHQANARLNEAIVQKLELSGSERRAPSIIEKYGNSASSGAIITFHESKSELAAGEFGYLCAFGAGYSIAGAVVRKL